MGPMRIHRTPAPRTCSQEDKGRKFTHLGVVAQLNVAATEGLWAESTAALLLFFTPGVLMLVVAKRGYLRAPRIEGAR